jgi:hypothetical protein
MNFTDKVNQTLVAFPELHIDGFNTRRGNHDAWDLDKIERLCGYIERNFIKSSKYTSTRGSYSLKHELEDMKWTTATDKYVSNGELILAMLCCGYEPKDVTFNSPNCSFKVKTDEWLKQGQGYAKHYWGYKRVKNWIERVDWERRLKTEEQFSNLWSRETFRYGYETDKQRLIPPERMAELFPPEPRQVVPV